MGSVGDVLDRISARLTYWVYIYRYRVVQAHNG